MIEPEPSMSFFPKAKKQGEKFMSGYSMAWLVGKPK